MEKSQQWVILVSGDKEKLKNPSFHQEALSSKSISINQLNQPPDMEEFYCVTAVLHKGDKPCNEICPGAQNKHSGWVS